MRREYDGSNGGGPNHDETRPRDPRGDNEDHDEDHDEDEDEDEDEDDEPVNNQVESDARAWRCRALAWTHGGRASDLVLTVGQPHHVPH